MKGAVAAMVIAAEKFIQTHTHFSGTLAILMTSDEEGHAQDGTKKVLETLQNRHIPIHYAIVGEASSEQRTGDQIRIGRRGSLHSKLIIHGKQGHVAFPTLANNPIHLSAQAIHELAQTTWDQGNDYFPPTTFQISNIQAGTGATNVIPGHLELLFNFRFSTAITTDQLKKRVTAILRKHQLDFTISWETSAQPFLTQQGKLTAATQQAIHDTIGLDTQLSTGGGTSDARFIAKTGTEVIELGVPYATAHQVNERVAIHDLTLLTDIYYQLLASLFK
jgi:succinyl-diaminopimelate desuccinylase